MAAAAGWRFVGCDASARYAAIARRRIKSVQARVNGGAGAAAEGGGGGAAAIMDADASVVPTVDGGAAAGR